MALKRKLAIQSILILLVMILQVMLPCISFAEDEVVGTWNISKTEQDNVTATLYNTGLLVIEGTGETVDNGYSSYPWDELIMNIKSIEIKEGVINIPSRAFDDALNLNTVNIAKTVKTIGDRAFNECPNLISIDVNDDNQYFCSVDGILFNKNQTKIINYPNGKKETEYIISDEIAEIGSYAFSGNNNLKSIVLSSGNSVIGSSAFYNCRNLSKVEFSDTIKTIESDAFNGCISLKEIVIPENVESLGSSLFGNCINLENVNISANIKTIPDYLFENCVKLTSVEIPDSVTYISYNAFNGCSALKNITLPDGITSIGSGAFRNCISLETITIPDGVTYISYDVFNGCTGLKNITLPDGITSIDDEAFRNCISLETITIPESVKYIYNRVFEGCTGLKTINIPANVSTINSSAFIGCSNIESINVSRDNANYVSEEGVLFNKAKTSILRYPQGKEGTTYKIPSTVTEIDDGAFEGCSSLKTIEIPQNVQYIYESAFEGCIGLETIEIPEGVERIGESAFKNCKNLRTITIPTTVTEIPIGPGYDMFEGCSSLQSINVTEGNECLRSDNGVVFYEEEGLMALIKYPEGKTDTEYNIPEGCIIIYPLAFRNVKHLETVKIPSTLIRIEDDEETIMMFEMTMFLDCSNLKNIEVNEANTAYCSEDGVLYTKDKKTLVKYPEGKTNTEYNISEELENIGYVAFYGANNLKNITVSENNNKYSSENGILFNKDKTMLIKYLAGKEDNNYVIPESVKSIEIAAFCDCKNLTSIDLSKNLEYIGYYAFTSPVPRTIYYSSAIIDVLEEYTGAAEDDEEYLKNLTFELVKLKSIAISKKPDKLIYSEGENFDTAGMIVEGMYNNGRKIEITDYQVMDGENLSLDKENVIISYTQDGEMLTVIQEIQMTAELLSIYIVKEPKTKYVEGEDFDAAGMEVVATYSDGSIKRIVNFSIEDGENLSLDKENVTISYTEGEITKTAKQKISVVDANYDDGSGDDGNTDDGEKPILKGDVDENGIIEFKDILIVNRHRLGKTVLTGKRLEAADATGDGKIDFMDILKINRYRLGKK